MEFEQEKNHHHVLFTAVALFVVLGGLAVFFLIGTGKGFFTRPAQAPDVTFLSTTTQPTTPQNSAVAPSVQIPTVNSISVSDQKLGLFVLVNEVKLVKPGFLLIRLAGKSGKPETTVGVSNYLSAGAHQDVKVNLYPVQNRPKISTGDFLFVTLVKDDGNKIFGELDYKDPALDATLTAPLTAKFQVL